MLFVMVLLSSGMKFSWWWRCAAWVSEGDSEGERDAVAEREKAEEDEAEE